MRKIAILIFLLTAFAAFAAAQAPAAGNVFFGYSYYNTDLSTLGRTSTNGWEGSLEGRILPFIGMVADFDGHYGSQNFVVSNVLLNANVSENNVLFGPRVSFSAGKFRPFAEALFGIGHVNANAVGTNTSFATALGGGLDYRLLRPIAWRIQGDYVQTRFFRTTQDNVRLSTGIVFRF